MCPQSGRFVGARFARPRAAEGRPYDTKQTTTACTGRRGDSKAEVKQILMAAGAGCPGRNGADHSNFARRKHSTDYRMAFPVTGSGGRTAYETRRNRRSFIVSAPGDVWFLCIAAKELAAGAAKRSPLVCINTPRTLRDGQ